MCAPTSQYKITRGKTRSRSPTHQKIGEGGRKIGTINNKKMYARLNRTKTTLRKKCKQKFENSREIRSFPWEFPTFPDTFFSIPFPWFPGFSRVATSGHPVTHTGHIWLHIRMKNDNEWKKMFLFKCLPCWCCLYHKLIIWHSELEFCSSFFHMLETFPNRSHLESVQVNRKIELLWYYRLKLVIKNKCLLSYM